MFRRNIYSNDIPIKQGYHRIFFSKIFQEFRKLQHIVKQLQYEVSKKEASTTPCNNCEIKTQLNDIKVAIQNLEKKQDILQSSLVSVSSLIHNMLCDMKQLHTLNNDVLHNLGLSNANKLKEHQTFIDDFIGLQDFVVGQMIAYGAKKAAYDMITEYERSVFCNPQHNSIDAKEILQSMTTGDISLLTNEDIDSWSKMLSQVIEGITEITRKHPNFSDLIEYCEKKSASDFFIAPQSGDVYDNMTMKVRNARSGTKVKILLALGVKSEAFSKTIPAQVVLFQEN